MAKNTKEQLTPVWYFEKGLDKMAKINFKLILCLV